MPTPLMMEIVPLEEASEFLGPISIHIARNYIEGFEKLSQTIFQTGIKTAFLLLVFVVVVAVGWFLSQICVTDNLSSTREN